MAHVHAWYRLDGVGIDHTTRRRKTAGRLLDRDVNIGDLRAFFYFNNGRPSPVLDARIKGFHILGAIDSHRASTAGSRLLAHTDPVTSRAQTIDTIDTAVVRFISG